MKKKLCTFLTILFSITSYAQQMIQTEADPSQAQVSYIAPKPLNIPLISTTFISPSSETKPFLDQSLEDYSIFRLDGNTLNKLTSSTLQGVEFDIEMHGGTFSILWHLGYHFPF